MVQSDTSNLLQLDPRVGRAAAAAGFLVIGAPPPTFCQRAADQIPEVNFFKLILCGAVDEFKKKKKKLQNCQHWRKLTDTSQHKSNVSSIEKQTLFGYY
jgi:hypothetical protein